VTANNTASSSVTPASADLALSITASPDNPNEGGTVTFSLTLSNNGPGNGTGITVTDLLPAGLTYLSHNASQGTYVAGSGIWTAGSVNAGAIAVLTLSAESIPARAVLPSQTRPASRRRANPTRPRQQHRLSRHHGPERRRGALHVGRPAYPNVGETVTFTVTLINHGPNHATGVTIIDLVPSGLTYVAGSVSQGSYAAASGLWSAGQVNSGGSAVLSLAAAVNPGTGGTTIINTAAVSAADQADPSPATMPRRSALPWEARISRWP